MVDVTRVISILIRLVILEIPVFYAVQFIWKNFIGGLKFILILVLSLLVYGLFSGLGLLLPSAEKFYLSTKLDSLSLHVLCMLVGSVISLVLELILIIYLRIKNVGYEEYDEDECEEW